MRYCTLVEIVEQMGMDAMSTGVVLGWATEAYQKQLVAIEQTLMPMEFGNSSNYMKAIEFIAKGENDFYKALGKGVAAASEIYGGEDFAMNFAGNEMPGYHTGYGTIVGTVVGARHSHLCNAGYSADQTKEDFDKEKVVEALYKEELERCMLNSLIICLFARKVYDRGTILAALNSIGYQLTNDDLTEMAEKIYKTKLRIKKALGFDITKVKLPKRFFETPTLNGVLDEKVANEMIEMYNKKTLI